MRVEELTSAAGIAALEPEWWELWERCPDAAPFQSPGWLLPWLRNLWGGGRLWTLALRADGRLVGVAPFFLYGAPEPRQIALIGSGITDYLDALIEPEWAERGGEAVWDLVHARRAEWDALDFQELRAGSPLLETARGVRREELSWCPVLELPSAWEELMARIPAKLRTDVRRNRNRLARAAELQFVSAGPDNLQELMCALFDLHEARWRERGEAGVTGGAALRSHYMEVSAAFLRRGMLRLYGLKLDGNWEAVFYGFAAHGRVYAYLDGFDPALAKLSPGSVLISMAIERAIAEGAREFDFLRQREGFKYDWGARDRVSYRLVAP